VVGARIADFTIALSVNGRDALLDVVRSDSLVIPGLGTLLPIEGVVGSLIFFESRDCSGAPFMSQPPERLFDGAVVAPPGMTLYLPEAPGMVPRTILLGSFLDALDGCQTSPGKITGVDDPLDPAVAADLIPAAAVVDLLTLFTPPFRLVFRD
jgi:hypothetical protein